MMKPITALAIATVASAVKLEVKDAGQADNINNQMEYKFILEVARHGARAPSVLYDYTAPGQDNFAAPMELS